MNKKRKANKQKNTVGGVPISKKVLEGNQSYKVNGMKFLS
jgi:hypothetical protein